MDSYLDYSKKDLANFHIALKSSQLVILAGNSGTGKTQLPFIYAKGYNIPKDSNQILFAPITPAYTDPSDILGYLKPNVGSNEEYDGTYIESQTGLVSFLRRAYKNRKMLHIVIFDEMNLSQIEYWFSPFMSILERKVGERKLTLYSENIKCSNANEYPPSIEIADNVIFIGTINLDETTKDLSDRLIDRAIIINLEDKSFQDYYYLMKNSKNGNKGNNYQYDSSSFFSFRQNVDDYISIFSEREIEFFEKLNQKMKEINTQKTVSYRTLKTIANYLNNAKNLDKFINRQQAIDLVLKETVIAKIKGADQSVRLMLSEDGILSILDQFSDISDFGVSRSAINDKNNELNNYGYTR